MDKHALRKQWALRIRYKMVVFINVLPLLALISICFKPFSDNKNNGFLIIINRGG